MKKKVFIFRFGTAMPTQKEHLIIDKITGGTSRATGCSTPFGVLSIVETSMKPKEITDLFDQVAKEHDDALPTIVFEDGDSVGFNFDPFFFKEFEECNQAYDEAFGTPSNRCTLSMDELLDLVKEKGVVNLTTEELKRLKELTKGF
jgi:hypothetical protein